MNIAEIKNLSNEELIERIATEEKALVQLKLNHAVSQLQNTAPIKATRRTVARLKTVLRERELNKQ